MGRPPYALPKPSIDCHPPLIGKKPGTWSDFSQLRSVQAPFEKTQNTGGVVKAFPAQCSLNNHCLYRRAAPGGCIQEAFPSGSSSMYKTDPRQGKQLPPADNTLHFLGMTSTLYNKGGMFHGKPGFSKNTYLKKVGIWSRGCLMFLSRELGVEST